MPQKFYALIAAFLAWPVFIMRLWNAVYTILRAILSSYKEAQRELSFFAPRAPFNALFLMFATPG